MISLPIETVLPELIATLRKQSSVVLRAPTGAGKTTRVPPALLDIVTRRVIVLEPRRVAARAAARRMSEERGTRLGDLIGYHVRFERQASSRTRLLVVTPGILLRMFQDDPYLETVDAIIFDEFHERSLESDLALGIAKLVQQTVRPVLKLVVMSATLESERIAAYLGGCPILASEGRLFPIEIVYEPPPRDEPVAVSVAKSIVSLLSRTDGDLLAFLPGLGEIRQAAHELEVVARQRDLLVMPLHGDLLPEQQDAALVSQPKRKVVLATNVAETSVTVEGVTGVVDSGLARVMMVDPGVGLDRLTLTPISKASADQRAGRAGRLRPGVCLRLWSELSHRSRPEQTPPEIRRVELAGAVLHLLDLGENDVRAFPWLEAPPESAVDQALTLLRLLGAMDDKGLTAMGRTLARLPVHPRLARLLVEGQRLGQLARSALVSALLAEREPFVRDLSPSNRTRRHRSDSDVLDRVEVLESFEQGRDEPSLNRNAARFILRARDQLVRELGGGDPEKMEADESIMRALLAAFPDRLARRREPGSDRGVMVGGRGVRLLPTSSVREAELFVCVDVDAGGSESLVRQASAVRRDWLPKENLTSRIEVTFDSASERVIARKRLRFADLLIEENQAAFPSVEEVSRLLTEAARANLSHVLPEVDSPAQQFLLRVRCLRAWIPEMGLPAFDEEQLRELVTWVCQGRKSFAEVRMNWLEQLQGKLTPQQLQGIEREAPERLAVPSGSRLTLKYEEGRPPLLAVRIQELFGLTDTPRIAGGRVKVLLHLLAPNYRPQQVTDDLASFWANTYPQVRKELRVRYPRHAWPEDPLSAQPEHRPRRRTS